jgi:hypothetical protein
VWEGDQRVVIHGGDVDGVADQVMGENYKRTFPLNPHVQ